MQLHRTFSRVPLDPSRVVVQVFRESGIAVAIQAGANIKALKNMLGHESAGLTLDRYGHLYGSDVEAVGVAINALLTRDCGQNVAPDAP